MALRCYQAMTAYEFHTAQKLPEHLAWMACHFSCYGSGLSNLPAELPEGSIIIINDRTPVCGHDPHYIADQLTALAGELNPSAFLLDFQREGQQETAAIVQHLIDSLPCPVGVSECYAENFTCPVFLPPPPLHLPLQEYLAPWSGREIWLEAATDTRVFIVDSQGSRQVPGIYTESDKPEFTETRLHCRYRISLFDDHAEFTLHRNIDDLAQLLQEVEDLGVSLAVGLYQELRKKDPED